MAMLPMRPCWTVFQTLIPFPFLVDVVMLNAVTHHTQILHIVQDDKKTIIRPPEEAGERCRSPAQLPLLCS